jgi:N-acetylneuraminate synthase
MYSNPFIIAELSGNHNGDINRAISLIELAHHAGADAVKLQTYTADTITINNDKGEFIIQDGLWKGYKLYDLYNEAHTPWEWHEKLFKFAQKIGIKIFSSPFDETAVDFLEKLNCPIYKIASFEITHHPLIKYIANTGKPIIMSTGMASLKEIEEAVQIVRNSHCKDLTLLHCVSAYPAPIENTNLNLMLDLKKRFPDVKIGLSDHSLGILVALGASALGAEVIEKHLTLARADGGVDAAFSLEPDEFKMLCSEVRLIKKALGTSAYDRSENENKNKTFRRSIFVVNDIKKGEQFSIKNIKIIRPSNGMEPKFYETILGRVAEEDFIAGTPLKLDMDNVWSENEF